MDLARFRKEYTDQGLRRYDLAADPIAQFQRWFSQATEFGLNEPNAMSLATAGTAGFPSQRTVLLKSFDEHGLVFFTNYLSAKARDIAENPRVSLLFPWIVLERQVSIAGSAEKTTAEESDEYFRSRPRDSQLGAWVSEQSSAIPSREFLMDKLEEIRARFGDGPIPRPPSWGGFRVIPEAIEFWQGGSARLHDRFLYRKFATGWEISRLSP